MKKLGIVKGYGHIFNLFTHSEKEKKNWGETTYSKGAITVANWLHGRKKEEVILHELIHIVNEYSALNLSENKVKALSYGLFGLLKDNFAINLNSPKKENKKVN
jgi:hypothetical protein